MILEPFRALRPARPWAPAVASEPYDIMSRRQYRMLAAPESFAHVVRSDIDLPDTVDEHAPAVYRRARANLLSMMESGILVRDAEPCFYIYEQTREGRLQRALVGAAPLDQYRTGIILRHEHTLNEKVADRMRHMDAACAQTGLVFLTYRDEAGLDALLRDLTGRLEAEADFVFHSGVGQRLWVVRNASFIKALLCKLALIGPCVIVDGHHRMEAASRLARKYPDHAGCQRMMCALVSSRQLLNLPNHRVIHTRAGETPERVLDRIDRLCFLQPVNNPYVPDRKGALGVYLDGRWYRCQWRTAGPSPLDVDLLQRRILSPILGIKNPSADSRFESVGGVFGPETLMEKADATGGVAFTLFPPAVDDVMALALRGRTMPPKSTWFEPKMLSGIVVRMLDLADSGGVGIRDSGPE